MSLLLVRTQHRISHRHPGINYTSLPEIHIIIYLTFCFLVLFSSFRILILALMSCFWFFSSVMSHSDCFIIRLVQGSPGWCLIISPSQRPYDISFFTVSPHHCAKPEFILSPNYVYIYNMCSCHRL